MITAIHKTEENKVLEVMKEMEKLGEPTIRAIETCHGLIAIEGCHRLEAADRLGMDVEILVIEEDYEIKDHGFQDFEGKIMTGAEIIDYIGVPTGKTYDF